MSACTFFGHRDCPENIKPKIKEAVIDMIINHGVTEFYVGNNGNFDSMVYSVLKELKQKYPQINFAVVLAYLPADISICDGVDTIYPEGLESVPKRFAISKRNDWMIAKCDYVICYITHNFGGAAQFVDKARRKGKTIVDVLGL